MTVAELIDEARDFHPSLTKQSTPDVLCMRALSRYQRRIASKVTALDEDALATPVTVSGVNLLTAVADRTGIVLPAHLYLLNPVYAVHTDSGGRIEVEITDRATRNTEGAWRFPAAYVLNGTLYPLNLMDVLGTTYGTHGWEYYGGLELVLVPLYDDLTGPTDVLQIPDVCRDALVNNLALFMAGRSKGVLADLPLLTMQAADAETAAVTTLVGQSGTGTWRIG